MIKKIKMKTGKDNVILTKSRDFAIEVIKAYKWLVSTKREYVISKQLLRSGTSIGAIVAEGVRGQSKLDFYSKFNIALKEANETSYWLDILHATDYLDDSIFRSINNKCEELISILVAITKTKNSTPQPPNS